MFFFLFNFRVEMCSVQFLECRQQMFDMRSFSFYHSLSRNCDFDINGSWLFRFCQFCNAQVEILAFTKFGQNKIKLVSIIFMSLLLCDSLAAIVRLSMIKFKGGGGEVILWLLQRRESVFISYLDIFSKIELFSIVVWVFYQQSNQSFPAWCLVDVASRQSTAYLLILQLSPKKKQYLEYRLLLGNACKFLKRKIYADQNDISITF